MKTFTGRCALKGLRLCLLAMPMVYALAPGLGAQTSTASELGAQTSKAQAPAAVEVPDWALPESATHKQIPPPTGFHRASRNVDVPIGMFQGQSDIGGALVPGSASYDARTKQYTINSAGYNIWYQRDEFRFLWRKLSGDFSLAADGDFPVVKTPEYDRKIVLIVRQDLDDDSREMMTGEHATGMVHLAERAEKGAMIGDLQYRIGGTLLKGTRPQRIGLEKHGDAFALFMSVKGEPMHQFGPPLTLHLDGPFYVGIGFCSHYPATVDTGVFKDVVLENAAGKVH
ncbi:MAG: hypothetical protein ACRYFU_26510 [Janthinobacterium lividum]